jgi:hypothetical protein
MSKQSGKTDWAKTESLWARLFVTAVLITLSQELVWGQNRTKAKINASKIHTQKSHLLKVSPKFPNASNTLIQASLDSVAKANLRYKTTPGYRVVLYLGTDRNRALEIKSDIYRISPEEEVFFQFSQPTFKVKIGNFLTRLEAENWFANNKDFFPDAIIIPEHVNLR